MPRCVKCNQEKEETEFYKRKPHANGKTYMFKYCNSCKLEQQRAWRENNKNKVLHLRKQYYDLHGDALKLRAVENQSKRLYGLTIAQRQEILKSQNGCCAICRCSAPGGKGWCVDHCHDTNKIRGILCFKCNCMLGLAKDNAYILKSAIDYLEKYNAF